jgi:flagellin
MSLRINTNTPALNAQRNLRFTSDHLHNVLEQLSSGQRINKSGDDAAGLAISENLRANIRGLGQAQRNADDGVSLIQVAEGGLNEMANILIRLRELGVQAASDTIGPVERSFLHVEYLQLLDEIDRVAHATTFNTEPLIDGSGNVFDIQVGVRNNPLIDRISFDAHHLNATTDALGIKDSGVDIKEKAQTSLAQIDEALMKVSAMRADLGAIQNRLGSTITNHSIAIENLSAANSRIRDADMAKTTSDLTRDNILMQSGVAVLSHANQMHKAALQLLNNG